MISDDDRREIATRLRGLSRCLFSPENTYELLADAFGVDDFEDTSDLFNRLADLIEPYVDRKALLRLSDKVFEDTEDDMRAPGKSVPAFIAGQCLRDVATRIREALGVTS